MKKDTVLVISEELLEKISAGKSAKDMVGVGTPIGAAVGGMCGASVAAGSVIYLASLFKKSSLFHDECLCMIPIVFGTAVGVTAGVLVGAGAGFSADCLASKISSH